MIHKENKYLLSKLVYQTGEVLVHGFRDVEMYRNFGSQAGRGSLEDFGRQQATHGFPA